MTKIPSTFANQLLHDIFSKFLPLTEFLANFRPKAKCSPDGIKVTDS